MIASVLHGFTSPSSDSGRGHSGGADLTFVSLSRWRTRPPGALGAVSTSLLALFLVDPLGPSRPGFQLSFAGALGSSLWLLRFEPVSTRGGCTRSRVN